MHSGKKIYVTSKAEIEIAVAAEWYEQKIQTLGESFLSAVDTTMILETAVDRLTLCDES